MKRSLLALAVLGAFAGAASAQSSVTLFGVVDLNVANISNKDIADNKTTTQQMRPDGINTNRLGFRGVEDLGGGMKAGFWLETGFAADTGASASSSKFFNRRATVSLLGNFGEVRLGRDYVATFWNLTTFDPFGTNGVGSLMNLMAPAGMVNPVLNGVNTGITTLTRADNAISYLLPEGMGGLYGQLQVAAGEGVVGNEYKGGRIGYAAGPFDIAVAYGQTQGIGDEDYKIGNIGAAYTFGPAKIMGQFIQGKYMDEKQRVYQLGTVVTMGQGEIHAAYTKAVVDGTENDSQKLSLGYVYNLSKRTALYATASQIRNDDFASYAVTGSGTTFGSAMGGRSTGVEAGMRHSF